MAKPRILVIGNSSIDFLLKTKTMPQKGETSVSNYGYSFLPSGKGLIAAVCAAELGSDVVMCTRVGNDYNGDRIKSLFAQKGIDPRFIKTDKKRATGLNTIITEIPDDKRIISCPGANSALSDEDLEEAYMSYPDAVLMHCDLADEIIYEATDTANKKKIPILLDPAGTNLSEFDIEPLGNIEIFTPNVDEVFKLTRIIPDDVESCLHACIKIINQIKCHYIIIKLGSKGCFVFDGVYSEVVPGFETTVESRDSVGTIFNAALLHKYLETNNITAAASFANAAAAVSLSKSGNYSAIPTKEETDNFISKNVMNFN